MKKIIVSSLLLVTAFTAALANDDRRSSLSTSSQAAAVPYPAMGQPAAGIHNILSDQLPPLLRAHIKEDYKGYWITELYVEGDHKESSYYITVEDAGQIVKMKATDSENWVITDTIVKDL